MTLADDIAAALPTLRAEAESMMLDACRIERPGAGQGVFNEATGQYDPPASTLVYEGPCRVQVTDGLNVQDAQAGERLVTIQRLTLHLPVSTSAGVQVDDVAVMTVATYDDALLGRRYRVDGLHAKSGATARRVQVEGISAGAAPVVVIDTYGAY